MTSNRDMTFASGESFKNKLSKFKQTFWRYSHLFLATFFPICQLCQKMEFPILFIHSAYMGLKITQLFLFMIFPI